MASRGKLKKNLKILLFLFLFCTFQKPVIKIKKYIKQTSILLHGHQRSSYNYTSVQPRHPKHIIKE